jgi:hypothetical protein
MIRIKRTDSDTIKKYFENPFVSQSKLKTLLYTIEDFQKEDEDELYYSEKKHFNIGDGVDVMITQGEEAFNRLFYVSQVNKPGDKILSICNYVFDVVIQENVPPLSIYDISEDLILQACNNEGYYTKWKDDTRVKSIINNGADYFSELCQSYGKQILSPDEYTTVISIVNSFKNNKVTSQLLFPDVNSDDDIDIEFQSIITFQIDGVPCKVMLDEVIVNHTQKTVQPIDIKTMYDYTLYFPISVRKRRYDIQGAFYTKALELIYNGYRILPFKFVVESTKYQGSPIVYTMTPELLAIGEYGRHETTIESDGVVMYVPPIFGYKHALENYKWYQANGFNTTRLIKENNYQLWLDWNNTYGDVD